MTRETNSRLRAKNAAGHINLFYPRFPRKFFFLFFQTTAWQRNSSPRLIFWEPAGVFRLILGLNGAKRGGGKEKKEEEEIEERKCLSPLPFSSCYILASVQSGTKFIKQQLKFRKKLVLFSILATI